MPISRKEGNSRNDKCCLFCYPTAHLWQALVFAIKYFQYLQAQGKIALPTSLMLGVAM